ncbi:MAG: SAM-dependent methyltransferase [Chloroflexia bacterium]
MESQRTPLSGWIEARIREQGPVTVKQFMEWALYHPEYGYYTRGPNIGPRGDFTTSPEASPAFAQMLARHVAEVDALLGNPKTFDIVEFGPGRGTLAYDLLDDLASHASDLYSRANYYLIEISPALVKEQKALLLPSHEGRVSWLAGLSAKEKLCGAVIANEFVDAFPVHVLEARDGVLCEQYVDVHQDGFHIAYRPPSSPGLTDFMRRNRLRLEDGEKVEINLAAGDWIKSTASAFSRCIALIVDYGDVAPARYSPTRKEGTLLGYHLGAVTDNILAHPGEQDLTALVDFTAIQDDAASAGFDVVGMTRQASFLIGLGLGADDVRNEAADLDTALKQRRGLQAVISMEGLGRFHVLILSKGIEASEARANLSGLKYSEILEA